MKNWYIYFNLLLIILLVLFLVFHAIPREKVDIEKIDKHYQRIKHNDQCLNYLQTINAIPTWRYSLIYGALFTAIQVSLYIVAGGKFNKKKYFLGVWVLYMLNFLYLYKMVANRSWHYVCSDGCLLELDL